MLKYCCLVLLRTWEFMILKRRLLRLNNNSTFNLWLLLNCLLLRIFSFISVIMTLETCLCNARFSLRIIWLRKANIQKIFRNRCLMCVRYQINRQYAIHHSDLQQKILPSLNISAFFVETVVPSPILHIMLYQGQKCLRKFSGKRCRFHVGQQ